MTVKTNDIAHRFTVSDVELGKALPTIDADQIRWSTKGRVEARGVGANRLVELHGNRFLNAVSLAYNQHYPLVLAPDHIWLLIAQGFSHHINENVENLRDQFVDHEGQKLIMIDVPPGKGRPFYPWAEPSVKAYGMEKSVLDTFVDKIRDNVKGEIVDTIMPTFSTTTIHSHAAMAVTTMSTFKGLFTYGTRTLCGIPEVTLLGEVEDWRLLREHAGRLSAYGTEFWLMHLLPVLDKIVESAEGNPDPWFWKQIIKVGGGSGGPHITGWVNTLLPYMESFKGKRAVNRYLDWQKADGWGGNNPNDYAESIAQVPVGWNYNGVRFKMEFEAGIVGASQDPITRAIQPEIGWAIADVTEVDG